MAEKRNITREDIFLKARLLSEGVRVEEKRPPANGLRRTIVLDGCEMVTILRHNPYSRLEAVIDGEEVTISDMGEVLGNARLEERFPWRDIVMSDGTTVDSALSGSRTIINIVLNFRCYNFDSGRGCKYCGLFAGPFSRSLASQPASITRQATARQIEAARVALTRKIRRGGKVWVRLFPDKPYTKKPTETRMGKGKGPPEGWVAVVRPGRILFEIEGVDRELAAEAMRLASHKLPIQTKFVERV